MIPEVLSKEKHDMHCQGQPTRLSLTLRGAFVLQHQCCHSMPRTPMSQDVGEVDSDDPSEDEWRNEFDAALSGICSVAVLHSNC